MAQATEREIDSLAASARQFRLHPSMQSITLEVILARRLRGGGRRRAATCPANEPDRDPRDDPLTGGDRHDASTGCAACPATAASPRCSREPTEILLAEIADRRADPDLEEREDILSMLVAARFDDGSEMADAELRDQLMTLLLAGPRDHRDGARLGVRPAVPRSGQAGAPARGGGRRTGPRLPRRGDQGDPAAPARSSRSSGASCSEPRPSSAATSCRPEPIVMPAIYLAHTRVRRLPRPYEFRPERFLDDGPGDLRLDPVRRRHPALHRRRVRRARDAGRAVDDPAPGDAATRDATARSGWSAATSPCRRAAAPPQFSSSAASPREALRAARRASAGARGTRPGQRRNPGPGPVPAPPAGPGSSSASSHAFCAVSWTIR